MTLTLPLAWIMALFHFRVGSSLHILVKKMGITRMRGVLLKVDTLNGRGQHLRKHICLVVQHGSCNVAVFTIIHFECCMMDFGGHCILRC